MSSSSPPVITGLGLWTAAGRGVAPLLELLDRGGRAFTENPPYPHEGIVQPRAALVAGLDRDRPAEALLLAVAQAALAQADLPSKALLGLVIGTSSGNIAGPWERWHQALIDGQPADEAQAGRDAPTHALARALGAQGPTATLSLACASGTAAFATALGWLAEGRCAAVLVAGVDALCPFVHAGFAALGALAVDLPRPLQADRDGLLLGEGAAALLVEPEAAARARGARPLAWVRGVGLSADAHHMTAPDPEGRGAAAAMRAALAEAHLAPAEIDGISLHATGTPFNDAMEAQALRAVFGPTIPPLHAIKAAIGHTLGAAGAIEAALCVAALQRGRLPPAPPAVDPALGLGPPTGPRLPSAVLSTSSAFGGANAVLVLASASGPIPSPRSHRVLARAEISLPAGPLDWRALWPEAPERWLRMSRYVRLGLLAVRDIARQQTLEPDVGLILASPSGCRATDLAYHARLLVRGAAAVSRPLFVHTVPGGPCGEASMHFQLHGPCLAFVGPMALAEEEAARLIRWGRARALIALAIQAPEAEGEGSAQAAFLVSE